MSIETKKKDKKENKSNKEEEEENIPTENIPDPGQLIQPPKPITLQDNKGIPRPTRLPPRYKSKTSSNSTNKIIPSTFNKKKENLEPIEREIKTPVSIRRTREPIPAIKKKEEKIGKPVIPTRIKLDEEDLENADINTRSKATSRFISSVLSNEELILKQFDVSKILKKQKESTWPWVKSKRIVISHDLEKFWRAEASLYSSIASIEFLTNANDKGDIAPEVYVKQLKSHLLEAIQLRFKLEKDNKFSWENFIETNEISSFFPEGIEKLARVSGSSDIDLAIEGETEKLDFKNISQLPTKTADFVSNSIELMDIIRLQSIATVERLIPLLEDLKKILLSAKMFGEDYWIIQEADQWIKRLYTKEAGTIPDDRELERLEMHVVRWLNDFRRELKNL